MRILIVTFFYFCLNNAANIVQKDVVKQEKIDNEIYDALKKENQKKLNISYKQLQYILNNHPLSNSIKLLINSYYESFDNYKKLQNIQLLKGFKIYLKLNNTFIYRLEEND